MPRKLNIESVKGRIPVRYRMHAAVRIPMIVGALLIAAWCLYVLFNHVNSDTSLFYKMLPVLVLFVALDSALRHLTSLNSVIFTPECLWLRFILKPSLTIPWENIRALEFRKVLTYYVFITYQDLRGKQKIFKTSASFPKILEIMYNIADLCPQLVMNDELRRMISVMKDLKTRQDQE